MNGAIQTRGTCWFFSIINGFLLSSDGQKLLFDHLKKFYKELTTQEKLYFDDGIDAPCPLKGNLIKTKRIYFWKFLDQYLCYQTGPRSISVRSGRSAKILGGMSLAGTVARAHSGGEGAFSDEELPKILRHLGITDYLIASANGLLPPEQGRKMPHFVICRSKNSRVDVMMRVPFFRKDTYTKMCCSITIGNSRASNDTLHSSHAITGYIRDGKGFLFDSNQTKHFPCDWWNFDDLSRVVKTEVANVYNQFKNGQVTNILYNFVIFVRNSYVKDIRPACLLKYKKATTPHYFNSNMNNINYLEKLERGNFGNMTGVQMAALAKKWGEHRAKPVIDKNAFNSILESAKTKDAAIIMVANLMRSGYRVNREAYEQFQKNLHRKLNMSPTPNSPKTAQKKKVQTNFANYWSKLNANNRQTVRNYIESYKNKVENAKKNLSAIKTAVGRKAWLKAKVHNFSPTEHAELRKHAKKLLEANRERRAKKKAA